MGIPFVSWPRVFADSYGSSGSERSSRPENAAGEEPVLRRVVPAAIVVAAIGAAIVLIANTALTGLQLGGIQVGPVLGAADSNFVPAGAPIGQIGSDPGDPDDPWSAAAPPGGVIVQTPGPTAGPHATGTLRIPIPTHVTRAMTGYFAFNWSRFQHAVAAHTPAVILETGYVSNDGDRALMLDKPDLLATAIADGVMTFLNDIPRSKIFGQDLVVPAFPSRPSRPTPSP